MPIQVAKAQFAEAEKRLNARGIAVVNPTRNGLPEIATWSQHLTIDIILLLSCQGIYMLKNWEQSRGAALEHSIARELGMAIEYEQPPSHADIKDAINRAMGVYFKEITSDNRNRWKVYARIIYVHHAKAAGDLVTQIAKEIRHHYSSVCYYLRKYDDEMQYNHEFKVVAAKVEELLR